MKKILLIIVVAFAYTVMAFAQCNIETSLKKDGFFITHRYETVDGEQNFVYGARMTAIRVEFEQYDSVPWQIRLYVIATSTHMGEQGIVPRQLQLLFNNNTSTIVQSNSYKYRQEVKANEFRYILSDEDIISLRSENVIKMIIIDDDKKREIKLKSPKVFMRQIDCIFNEIENLGKGNLDNVVKVLK